MKRKSVRVIAMLTGALRGRSGICYNQPRGSRGEWNWEAKYIKAPTLWTALHKSGLTSAAVMWPGSVGAEITYNISEIWAVDHPDDRIGETRKRATPGLVEEIEKNAIGRLDSINMSDGYLSLDENAGRMAPNMDWEGMEIRSGWLSKPTTGLSGMCLKP